MAEILDNYKQTVYEHLQGMTKGNSKVHPAKTFNKLEKLILDSPEVETEVLPLFNKYDPFVRNPVLLLEAFIEAYKKTESIDTFIQETAKYFSEKTCAVYNNLTAVYIVYKTDNDTKGLTKTFDQRLKRHALEYEDMLSTAKYHFFGVHWFADAKTIKQMFKEIENKVKTPVRYVEPSDSYMSMIEKDATQSLRVEDIFEDEDDFGQSTSLA